MSIFSSALYFPSVVSDNVVVRQALTQGEHDYQSTGADLETPAAATTPEQTEPSETVPDAVDGDAPAATMPAAEQVPATTTVAEQKPLQTPATRLPTTAAAKRESKSDQPAPTVTVSAHHDALPEDTATPDAVTSAPSAVALGTTAPVETLDPAPTQRVATEDALQQTIRPHTLPPVDNIASLIVKMKEKALRGSSPANDDATRAFEAPLQSIANSPEDKTDRKQAQTALEPSASAAIHVPQKVLTSSSTPLMDEDGEDQRSLVAST